MNMEDLERRLRVMEDVEDLRWSGPARHLEDVCSHLDAPRLAERARRLAADRR